MSVKDVLTELETLNKLSISNTPQDLPNEDLLKNEHYLMAVLTYEVAGAIQGSSKIRESFVWMREQSSSIEEVLKNFKLDYDETAKKFNLSSVNED